jgi:hypothetical protein
VGTASIHRYLGDPGRKRIGKVEFMEISNNQEPSILEEVFGRGRGLNELENDMIQAVRMLPDENVYELSSTSPDLANENGVFALHRFLHFWLNSLSAP